jgi:hypothetical protein
MNRILRSSLAKSLPSRLRVTETGFRNTSPRFQSLHPNSATLLPFLQGYTPVYSLRLLHSQASGEETSSNPTLNPNTYITKLPLQCPGCGAFTQTSSSDDAGFYDIQRRRVQNYIQQDQRPKLKPTVKEEDQVVEQLVGTLGEEELKKLGLDPSGLISDEAAQHGEAPSEIHAFFFIYPD